MPSICMFTFSPPLIVNSDAGFGGPFGKSLGRFSPPYWTGISSGLINLNTRKQLPSESKPKMEIEGKLELYSLPQNETEEDNLSNDNVYEQNLWIVEIRKQTRSQKHF